jgi:DNA-binding beta-propeller fold protein YncE
MKDGRYKISFLPTETGTSECAVTINGEMMAGFPLSITVRPPTIYPEIGMKGEKAIYSTKGEDMGAVDSPVGAVLDPSCTQCVLADSANHRIQVFDVTTGNALCSYGVHGKNAGEFSCPSHVCVLQQGTSTFTCVTDMLNHRVQIFEGTTTGKFLRAMGTKGGGDGQLLFPRGVAANEDGELYVCDQGNHRMCVFNAATGACVRKFGGKGTGPGQFNTPIAVTVDMDGRVLVTDKNHRVQVFDKLGTFLDQWGKKGRKDGEFNYPSAIAVDDEGSVFVCDSSNRRVQIFGPDGKPKHKWGGSKADVVPAEGEEGEAPPAEAEGEEGEVPVSEPWNGMKKPMGIALARDGTIWVVDHEKNQILVY